MDEALASSPTLAIAAARTRKAVAFASAQHATLAPQVNGTASSTRERFSANGLLPPPLGGSVQTDNQLQASLSWEIDFWGRNRAAYEAAVGAAHAAEVDAVAARLALSTNLAQAYVQLERAYLLRDVVVETLREREQIAALTRNRNDAGLDSRLEVKQAEAALPATREQISELDERIGLLRNQMAALLGAGPDRGLDIARPTAIGEHKRRRAVDGAGRAHRAPPGCRRATLACRSRQPRNRVGEGVVPTRTSTWWRSSGWRASAAATC